MLRWAIRPLLDKAAAKALAHIKPADTSGVIFTREQWSPFVDWSVANLMQETGFNFDIALEKSTYQTVAAQRLFIPWLASMKYRLTCFLNIYLSSISIFGTLRPGSTKVVQGHQGGIKTVRSNREIHLHENVVKVLSEQNPAPLSMDPEDFLFTTPQGTAIDESNFYNRELKPMLRRLKNTRPRPFYNTRHSYVSFLARSAPDPVSSPVKPATASRRSKPTMRSTLKRPMITVILPKNRSRKVQP